MSKTIAIMQPYFLPYIGYWQLMNAVDQFVVYDNIQFTKRGWINRNRFLLNGKVETFTLPLKKDSDYLDVRERYLKDDFYVEAKKLIRRFEAAYKIAPYYKEGIEILEKCLFYEENNLFKFIFNSIQVIKSYIGIETRLVISSEISIDHRLRSSDKVKAICNNLGANCYVNPIGGIALYDKNDFNKSNITLKFIQTHYFSYQQISESFVPCLSIIDIIMNCSKFEITSLITKFSDR
ncbi:WbqC family protein [Methylotuvimicrobium sp.]|uniref:WbqC family protein n=1 Tax=Methylotuvimicrobium sp. TaxID=2822413 RepID=UPI003D6589E6